jgi:DNA primase
LPDDADGKGIWLGVGVVIPCQFDGALWYVKTRVGPGDYRHVKGGCGVALYNADEVAYLCPVVLVESELCALAVQQTCWDMTAAVATGTTVGARRPRWLMRLAMASRVYVALDSDEPGNEAAAWWLERLGERAERLTPTRKDPGDMMKEDGPAALRQWVGDKVAEGERV